MIKLELTLNEYEALQEALELAAEVLGDYGAGKTSAKPGSERAMSIELRRQVLLLANDIEYQREQQ